MKKLFLSCLVVLLSTGISLEIAGYLSTRWMPGLYDTSSSQLETRLLQKKSQFESYVQERHGLYGWRQRPSGNWVEQDCIGQPHRYILDQFSTRIYPGYSRDKVQLLISGDSFIWGFQVDNDQTVAAHLYRQTGIVSANLADNSYNSLQALLRLQAEKADFPAARIALIEIIDDARDRLANSYPPVLYGKFSGLEFALRPYMRDGAMHLIDPDAFSSFPHFVKAARTAFASDYWAKPKAGFPYSLALLRALTSHHFQYGFLPKLMHILHRDYRSPELDNDQYALVSAFAGWAKQEQLLPVVFFIPWSYRDSDSASQWIAKYKERLPGNLIVRSLDFSRIDPAKYNLRPDGRCHPSDYGANEIARQIAAIVKPILDGQASAVPPADADKQPALGAVAGK